MALSVNQKDMKQVPWFSLAEWHQVYQQVYSSDKIEQTKAYETLLAWQARVPKLPVGVDCTLSILQVCLRDLEWTPKINNDNLPISYENDLCLMYSTTIMRFLNHISNIGHTKQTSLFQIAKQVNIPEWIVNLRHDTAHGHELPSIGVLRIAINILLTWLHEEYWAVEAKELEESVINNEFVKEAQETEEIQEFSDLIELWTAVSLYIHAGYTLVKDIPDSELVETLQDLRSYAISLPEQNKEDLENDNNNYIEAATVDIKKDKKYKLETARMVLLSEISRYLSKKSIPNKKDVVCDELFNSEAFLPNKDVLFIFIHEDNSKNELKDDILPLDMMIFWKDIMFLLCEKGMMGTLIIRLLKLVENEEIDKYKRLLASLWISSIAYSFVKLDVAHCISRSLEYELKMTNKKLPLKAFELKVKEKTENAYPHLKYVLWFNLSDVVLSLFTDINFVSKLILNANEFSIKFVLPILELLSPKIDAGKKQLLLNLLKIYTEGQATDNDSLNKNEKTFTIKDVHNLHDHHVLNVLEQNKSQNKVSCFLRDQKVRNTRWKLAFNNYQWAECPVGLLPWQTDSMETLKPLKSLWRHNISTLESEITPGILNSKDLKMQSQINWDNVLRKKKRPKRKHDRRNADIIINRALETAKKQK